MAEMMIVIAILSVVVAIAVPSYRAYVLRANRAEAIEALMAAGVCQERIYSRTNAYDASECGGLTVNGAYNVTVTTQNSNQEFTLTATPQGAQVNDSCGSLSVDQRGTRTTSAGAGAGAKCWSGKHYATPSS